jgi:pimeloyl-ACP methyl ester carboxylesterase
MNGPLRRTRLLCVGVCTAIGLALLPAGVSAGAATITCSTAATKVCTGATTESSGLTAQFKIEIPSNFNGTLVLYSHGYDSFTVPLPPGDAPDDATGAYLLSQGYALAGSAYARAGWSVEQAFQDQIAVLDVFKSNFGQPARTIAWGSSMGGLITAGLVQKFPNRFTAALPMCGVVEGGPGIWNEFLDAEFALSTLVSPFKFVNLTAADVGTIAPFAPGPAFIQAETVIGGAQATPAGRARTALAAAVANIPGWYDTGLPEPGATDYTTREANQYKWLANIDFLFGYFGRYEMEVRAGGNVSWNTGVDYSEQLAKSSIRAEVKALYAAAGLDLEKDLDKLNDAPRIAADPKAAAYLAKFITFNGDIDMPVLTLHTTGDGLVEPTAEQAYASVVNSAGDSSLLRQTFVHRAGHCAFTPAEMLSAFKTLIHRVDTQHWSGTSPSTLNAQATSLGSALNVMPASFVSFIPTRFLRPFDVRNLGDANGNDGDSG